MDLPEPSSLEDACVIGSYCIAFPSMRSLYLSARVYDRYFPEVVALTFLRYSEFCFVGRLKTINLVCFFIGHYYVEAVLVSSLE